MSIFGYHHQAKFFGLVKSLVFVMALYYLVLILDVSDLLIASCLWLSWILPILFLKKKDNQKLSLIEKNIFYGKCLLTKFLLWRPFCSFLGLLIVSNDFSRDDGNIHTYEFWTFCRICQSQLSHNFYAPFIFQGISWNLFPLRSVLLVFQNR